MSKKTKLFLAIIAVMIVWSCLIFAVHAAYVSSGNGTWISDKLTYTYSVDTSSDNTTDASGSVSVSGNMLTISATRAKQYETGGCNSTTVAAADTTTTVTVTNASSYPLLINTLTPNNATVGGVAQGDTIASGATFTITVTAPAVSSTTVTGTVTIAVEEQNSVEITLAPSPYVSYTVNGTTVAQDGSNQTFTAEVGDTISLPAITAPSGYEFKGWRVGSNLITGSSFSANAGYTVFPVIVTAGTDTTAANFKVGSNTYTFWEDAVTAALGSGGKMIVNLENVTLPSTVLDNALPAAGGTYVKPVTGGGVEYIIPSGVTLLVPFDANGTMYTTTPAVVYNSYATPTAFRTLTMPDGAKITVKGGGAISLSSKLASKGQMGGTNGTPTGPDGRIHMFTGSSINLENGANLYCWGYIWGGGSVVAESGSTVYEAFQVKDWRGGDATLSVYSYVFIFNQYYVQNIEVPLTLYAGASEKLYSSVNALSSAHSIGATLIGDGGLFRITSGYVVKDYLESPDQLSVSVHGNVTLSPMTISGLPMINSISTSEYIMPINNMRIDIQSGKVNLNQNLEFLPCAEVYVAKGATFEVSSGKKVYLYDEADWGNFTGSARLYAVGYSVANGTTAIRTASNLRDAKIDVDGTVDVKGSLFTSAGGADIMSSQGYDGTNGKVVFSTAPTATSTIYECADNSTKTAVDFTAPKLHNGDDSYSATASTGASTWKYDKPGEHWYRYLVDFKYNDTLIQRGFFCENGDSVTYDASWLSDISATASNGTATVSGTNVNVSGVTADSIVTLTGTPAEYIPTFVLNEHQYEIYQLYTGNTITSTATIAGNTYYIVNQGSEALAVGTTYAAPTDAAMGISADNHNSIIWNMSGLSYTSGDPYRGTVPVGETAGEAVYIYGFYDGVVAYNSTTDSYYRTLAEAMENVPQDGTCTIRLVAHCGTFEEESGTLAFPNPANTTLTVDLNGYHALGRIVNNGTLIMDLNGGTWDYHTGAAAAAATYAGTAAVTNSGTMTIQDSVGTGKITQDAISNSGVPNHSAVIRNNSTGNLTVTGVTLESTQDVNGYFSVVLNDRGTITKLEDVTMRSPRGYAVFNYGGHIATIDSCDIDVAYGIYNRNVRGSNAIAQGYNIANYGTIDLIKDSTVTVGQYAINNSAVITTMQNTTFTAHPDSAQVNTYGTTAANVQGNVQAYTVYNNNAWWYDSAVWKRTDVSSGTYTRTDDYKEDEQYRPTIGQIIDCNIYAENTSTNADHGCALYNNGGVIGTISGGEIKTYNHSANAKITTSNYALRNTAGGIIKSIEGNVTISATGNSAVYNDGQFTTKTVNTYSDKVGGIQTHNTTTYGEPSTIISITASGTISATSTYGLYNSGYIGNINSTGLTIEARYSAILNSGSGACSSYDYTRYYTDPATAATEYKRVETYTRNLNKGGVISSISGITLQNTGSKGYFALQNQGYIGTLSYVTIGLADGATAYSSVDYPLVLNGDSRQAEYTLTRNTNYTADFLTITSGIVTRYDYSYDYDVPTINLMDHVTITSSGTYAFKNMGKVATLRNSTITGSQYALVNFASGPYLHRDTLRLYSGTAIFGASKSWVNSTNSKDWVEQVLSYTRNPAEITTIDNCTISTPANTYALKNSGYIESIKNSNITAGTTTAKAYALFNGDSRVRAYSCNIEDWVTVVADGATSNTIYYGMNGESKVVVYDYDAPTIDLIGEGNTFKATTTVIANTGIITAIDSGEGELTTITGSAAKGSSIYNYSACLDTRTTTTPYTAAASAGASGTAGTAVNDDTLLPGAQIGTIKNVYINANGWGILNGDAAAGKTPTIGEIGEGTEIYANCTTADYHAIYNQANAKITRITGGVYTVTKATTNAYKNNNTAEGYATLISGGDFKGMSATRANAIFEPDNTNRQTYEDGKKLSANPHNVNFNNGTTVASGTGYYYITNTYTVSFDMQDHGTDQKPADQTVESGQKVTKPDDPTAEGYAFDGWYTTETFETEWLFSEHTVTADTTLYAKWVKTYTVTWMSQDGNTTLKTDTVKAGEVPEYNDTAPTKASDGQYNYTFNGWASSVNQEDGLNLSQHPVDANVTYYAAFSKSPVPYTITFNAGGGTGTMNVITANYGAVVQIPACTFEKNGYTFLRWIGSNSKGYYAVYDKESVVFVNDNITLTAEWQPNQGTANTQIQVNWYDNYKNKGTCDSNTGRWTITDADSIRNDFYNNASQLIAPVAPSHLGLRFLGWSIYVYSGSEEAYYAYMSVEGDTDGSITSADILDYLNDKVNENQTADVYAQYTTTGETANIVLKYKLDGVETDNLSGAVDNVPAQAKVGSSFTLAANASSTEGYKFDHWEYGDNDNIASASLTIRASSTDDVVIYACYVSTGEGLGDGGSLFYVTDMYAENVNGVDKVAITLAWDMPKDEAGNYVAEIVKLGFYCSKDYNKVSGCTVTPTAKTPSNGYNGSYTLHISSKSGLTGENDNFYVKPYIIYRDESGEHEIISEDIYVLNWKKMSEEKGVRYS